MDGRFIIAAGTQHAILLAIISDWLLCRHDPRARNTITDEAKK
jgi:hypothetical protein